MGKAFRPCKVQALRQEYLKMIRFVVLILWLALPAGNAAPAKSLSWRELPLRLSLETAKEQLTTERLWMLDPAEANPHRQRWALERSVKLDGLKAMAMGKDEDGVPVFGISASHLKVTTKIHLRGEGPWYREIGEFSCSRAHDGWFGTQDGAFEAAKAGAREWEEVIENGNLALARRLSLVREASAPAAEDAARRVLEKWLAGMKSDWSVRGRLKARSVEWGHYLGLAARQGVCKAGPGGKLQRIKAQKTAPSWHSMIEKPLSLEPVFIARAPAKRWNGLYTVRLNIKSRGIKLNGQFLVDSGASASIVSPVWLKNQGIKPSLIEISGVEPRRVVWSGGRALARTVRVDEAVLGGETLGVRDFLLLETELFVPPQSVSSCCDGVLGADFLRAYAVEFHPGPPVELKLWRRDGFAPKDAGGWSWLEAAFTARGDIVGHCALAGEDKKRIWGARIDSGSEMAVAVHVPWQSGVRADLRARSAKWKIECDGFVFSESPPVEFPGVQAKTGGIFAEYYPGINIGMALLGRGRFVFDLPHGRIWFDNAALRAQVPRNRTGIGLSFGFDSDGDRVLLVSKIISGSPAEVFARAGLKTGMTIEEIDSITATDLDAWEVERRLSGVYGDTVSLKWIAADGSFKLAATGTAK